MTKKNLTMDEIKSKSRLIKRLSFPAIVILVLCMIFPLALKYHHDNLIENHQKEFTSYLNYILHKNGEYLKGVADKIKNYSANTALLSTIQSEVLFDEQKPYASKKYIWMTDVNDNFLFGLPNGDFTSLNNLYSKYSEVIKNDGYYKSRNDFIGKLVDIQNNLDFSVFERKISREYNYGENARFYMPMRESDYYKPFSMLLAEPVYNDAGKYIGVLHMKINDKANQKKYSRSWYDIVGYDDYKIIEVILLILAVTLLYLWFLIPTWIYADASLRNVKKPLIWSMLGLVTFVFGLIIYVIIRPSTERKNYCPKCTGELNGASVFCPHCGIDLSASYCRSCGYPLKEGWHYCPECRAQVRKPENYILPAGE